jgi:hypothetical protein
LDTPKTFQELLQHAVNILFALVLLQSFPLATKIFTPLSNLNNYFYFVNAVAILFVYFFIITSWIGYFKSIQSKQHSEKKSGLARFGIDIFIIYLYYYLVQGVIQRELNSTDQIANYNELFLWILPIIAGAFVLWDGIKWLEHKPDPEERANRLNRMLITWIFFGAIILQAISYYYSQYTEQLRFGNIVIWDIFFFIISFLITFFYRKRKWLIKEREG